MKQPPLRFLEVISSLLALLAVCVLIALVVVIKLPRPAEDGSSLPTAQASAAPAYDEQKAIAAGLQPSPAGKQLFNNNCRQCHAIEAIVVGPALGNVTNRRSTEWIHAFVRNSSQMIKSGDPVAKELYEQFNKTQMPGFKFSDEELTALLDHIKFETSAYGM
ncbi:quinol:cytochrome c oxidoreductase pentaheme cytochrome subunit [Flammeovirgaceae bacterium 311]|nr:quinol:cytochrome c oxidoreductase pentaheme cytochrome subunit [Flammeovirgaceae bacterium 311]